MSEMNKSIKRALKNEKYQYVYYLLDGFAKKNIKNSKSNMATMIMEEIMEFLTIDLCKEALELYMSDAKNGSEIAIKKILDYCLEPKNDIVRLVFNNSVLYAAIGLFEENDIYDIYYMNKIINFYESSKYEDNEVIERKIKLAADTESIYNQEDKDIDGLLLYGNLIENKMYDYCFSLIESFKRFPGNYINQTIPNYQEFWDYEHARIYFLKRNYSKAIEEFSKINTKEAIYKVGRIYFQIKDFEKALFYFKTILEKNDFKTLTFVIKCRKLLGEDIKPEELDELERWIKNEFDEKKYNINLFPNCLNFEWKGFENSVSSEYFMFEKEDMYEDYCEYERLCDDIFEFINEPVPNKDSESVLSE